MAVRTSPQQRLRFSQRHQQGETYEAIARSEGVSFECVRYWCRRQRAGGSCSTPYHRPPTGLLSRFDPKVPYCVLRLRLQHPRWGPNRLRYHLAKRASLHGLPLPSEAEIGRYLHQWDRFRRHGKPKTVTQRPQAPTHVHQRWQVDFKVQIALKDGTQVDLYTCRDPFGEACIDAHLVPNGRVGTKGKRPSVETAQAFLRACFARWHTLPDEIQTDGEPALSGRAGGTFFPTRFMLWLKGLGIDYLVTRSGKPTDNAEVERCHRTLNDYVIRGQEHLGTAPLEAALDQAVHDLAYELPSQATGCCGQPPVEAHPELLQPRRPYRPEYELALFDLKRVDTYLATFTWKYTVSKNGEVSIGESYYYPGYKHRSQEVVVRFDPVTREFVFYLTKEPEKILARCRAKGLDVADLTRLGPWPAGPGVQQLSLPGFGVKG